MVSSIAQVYVQERPMPPRGKPPEGYLTVEQAGELASVGRASAYRYSERGGLWEQENVRVYHVGVNRRYIEESSLRAWIASRGGPA